jgi:hypothetical protein
MNNQQALDWLRHQFVDFEFMSPNDEARFIVYLTMVVVRPNADWSPLFVFSSDRPGSGCSLAAHVGRLLSHPDGTFVAITGGKRYAEEDLSALGVANARSIPFAHCDKAPEVLESHTLAGVLASTDGQLQVRKLGGSGHASLSGLIITASGVHTRAAGDLARRTLTINLTRAGDLRTAVNKTFVHPDLQQWVRDNRDELTSAIAAITSRSTPVTDPTYDGFLGNWAAVVLNPLSLVLIDGVSVRELAMSRAKNPEE